MSDLYQKVGSMTAIKTLVNEFYDVMEIDPYAKELRDAHAKILKSSNLLINFLPDHE